MEPELYFRFKAKIQSFIDDGVILDACGCWNQGQRSGNHANSDKRTT